MHAGEYLGEWDRGIRGEQWQHEIVFLGQVGLEEYLQGVAGGCAADRVGGPGELVDQAGEDSVFCEHAVDEQPGRIRGGGRRLQRLFLGGGVRRQLTGQEVKGPPA